MVTFNKAFRKALAYPAQFVVFNDDEDPKAYKPMDFDGKIDSKETTEIL